MNEMINENEVANEAGPISRPKLAMYHANPKGTGAAVTFELHPAHDVTGGSIMMLVAPQSPIGDRTAEPPKFPRFDWENAITAKLDFNDLCLILQVLRGETEDICEGKGLHHRTSAAAISIKLRHIIEPVCGYHFDVCRRNIATGEERRALMLMSPAEALGLSEAISGSMVRIAFGD